MGWRAQGESSEKSENALDKAKNEPLSPWAEMIKKIEVRWAEHTQGKAGGAIKIAVFIAVLIVVSAFVLYVFGAFIAGEFNPKYWTDLHRFLAALLWFLLAGPVVIYIAIKNTP